jgi:hypothetical protein
LHIVEARLDAAKAVFRQAKANAALSAIEQAMAGA